MSADRLPGLYISIYSLIFIAEQFWKFGYFRKSFDNPKLFQNFSEIFPEPFRNFLRIFLKFFWMDEKFLNKKHISNFFFVFCACLVSLPIFQPTHLLILRLHGITFRIKTMVKWFCQMLCKKENSDFSNCKQGKP